MLCPMPNHIEILKYILLYKACGPIFECYIVKWLFIFFTLKFDWFNMIMIIYILLLIYVDDQKDSERNVNLQ